LTVLAETCKLKEFNIANYTFTREEKETMHGLLSHILGSDQHSHVEAAPQTAGKVIHWAKYYDLLVNVMGLGQAGRLRRKTIDLASIRPGESILDVGCGTGDLTRLARETTGAAGQVVGIDASPEMIDVARRKAARQHSNVDFRVGLIEQLAFADETFDVALSSLMIHHLPVDLRQRGLQELRRVVKPGGRLVIVDFKQDGNLNELAALVKTAGFDRVETGDMHVLSFGFVRASK
jgi:ubiquinone/menaquinone biosynthesis C-methylase UbiE